ncbi:MAG: polymer-forming cytoskeletal protein [bacterium]
MFSRDEKGSKESDTIIGRSVKVKGDFLGEGNLIIDGEFEGTITTLGSLFFGEKSHITAQISGGNAKILGKVNGDIKLSGSIDLGKNAEVVGNISATSISIEHGAIINGHIIITKGSTENPRA